MVTAQLIAKNYESSGFVLFTVEVRRFMSFNLQVDLKIWLPLFVATLLFLHGQFRECPGGDKLITLDYYTFSSTFSVFSSDSKDWLLRVKVLLPLLGYFLLQLLVMLLPELMPLWFYLLNELTVLIWKSAGVVVYHMDPHDILNTRK
jgi:hypothetical protein